MRQELNRCGTGRKTEHRTTPVALCGETPGTGRGAVGSSLVDSRAKKRVRRIYTAGRHDPMTNGQLLAEQRLHVDRRKRAGRVATSVASSAAAFGDSETALRATAFAGSSPRVSHEGYRRPRIRTERIRKALRFNGQATIRGCPMPVRAALGPSDEPSAPAARAECRTAAATASSRTEAQRPDPPWSLQAASPPGWAVLYPAPTNGRTWSRDRRSPVHGRAVHRRRTRSSGVPGRQGSWSGRVRRHPARWCAAGRQPGGRRVPSALRRPQPSPSTARRGAARSPVGGVAPSWASSHAEAWADGGPPQEAGRPGIRWLGPDGERVTRVRPHPSPLPCGAGWA